MEQKLLNFYKESAHLQKLAEFLSTEQHFAHITSFSGSELSFITEAFRQKTKKPIIIVVKDREKALYIINDLETINSEQEAVIFPPTYKSSYQVEEVQNANILKRTEILNDLKSNSEKLPTIITTPEALVEKVVSQKVLKKNSFSIKVGDELDSDFLSELLDEYGFLPTNAVYEPGFYAIRGNILDIFSFAHHEAFRLVYDEENCIEQIKIIDTDTQFSTKSIDEITLTPNLEQRKIFEEKLNFLEYLPKEYTLFVDDIENLKNAIAESFEKATEYYNESKSKSADSAPLLSPEKLYATTEELNSNLNKRKIIIFNNNQNIQSELLIKFHSKPQPNFQKNFDLLCKHLHLKQEQGFKLFIAYQQDKQIQRLEEIFHKFDEELFWDSAQMDLHSGFESEDLKVIFYTEHEVFERFHRYKTRRKINNKQSLTLKELRELQPGDYVTHVNHGVGRFAGLTKIKNGDAVQEAVKLIYRDNDVLYVNVNALYKISKYSSAESSVPKLHKIGSGEWEKKKAKAKKRVKELAFDLIGLYAKRKAQNGFAFSADDYLMSELEASFEFEETPDQLKVIDEIKKDMEQAMPMDRLVCGDVGFGKTEVAIRAAFKAVADGKQVAILAPTTVLTLQHFKTFSKRLENLPVTIDYINRIKSTKQNRETLQALSEGKIDMLIGTHRLLSKDVKFKDLGLLVIDEEQKFGVNAKDKLKIYKTTVDTLTLTATPIPRTLQFSLLGVRDMSMISTPPPNRLPVETKLFTFDKTIVRDAIAYELERGGQVYFVHNRIKDLTNLANLILELVPDARVKIGHGQMKGEKIEKIMTSFIQHEIDVLVSTSIVESGLDIPNANTIIINDSHMFGLSDLHQLRGRVGRSGKKAFCILFSPQLQSLSVDARKRLSAMEQFSDIGSGLHIALRDLDIRGAGDILGGEQSGFINDLGYELYHKILNEAIEELKEEHFVNIFADQLEEYKEKFVSDCQIDSDLDIFIPEEYMPAAAERLNYYKKIAGLSSEEEIREFSKEILDKFGRIPEQVFALLDMVRIRELAKEIAIEKVSLRNTVLRFYLVSNPGSKFYDSELFQKYLSFIHTDKEVQFKEKNSRLMLIYKNIDSIKFIYFKLKKIHEILVDEKLKA